ncbi:hypothetical protein EUGRSUZ_A00225 [Eucalyptus grandis]|uniref:PGG domain-containing protein n=2 Tax=Eucalyptus grandis TaxID=71139 RepID=A0A059DAS2_EUCGR|nr:hypothetical protein EUGRSUZ_A00225 [Eucalyptus grandis]
MTDQGGSETPSRPSKDDKGITASSESSKDGTPVDYEKLQAAVDIYQRALDDLVSVNSLFTVAVFVGLAFASAEQQNLAGNRKCEAGVRVGRRLVKNEVISFAFYLFSSLVAKSLKTHLFTYLITDPSCDQITHWSSKVLRGSLFFLSTATSIIGGVLLLYSMIDMIQLRLGKVTCKGIETLNAVGVLIAVNIFALLIYIPFVAHAIVKSTTIFDNLCTHCPVCHNLIPEGPVSCPP